MSAEIITGTRVWIDPDATSRYRWDWSAWLGDETITGHELLPVGIEVVSHTRDATTVTVRVRGAEPGSQVTCRVTSSGGRIDDRTIRFAVAER